jgi:hypothetical protein
MYIYVLSWPDAPSEILGAYSSLERAQGAGPRSFPPDLCEGCFWEQTAEAQWAWVDHARGPAILLIDRAELDAEEPWQPDVPTRTDEPHPASQPGSWHRLA